MIHRPSPLARNRRVLALDFIRRFFTIHGSSPSFSEIAAAIGVPVQRVSSIIRDLAVAGDISWSAGRARSIELSRRAAMFATEELLLELQCRGYVAELRPAAEPIATIYAAALVEGVTNQELSLIETLDQIAAGGGAVHGEEQG